MIDYINRPTNRCLRVIKILIHIYRSFSVACLGIYIKSLHHLSLLRLLYKLVHSVLYWNVLSNCLRKEVDLDCINAGSSITGLKN